MEWEIEQGCTTGIVDSLLQRRGGEGAADPGEVG